MKLKMPNPHFNQIYHKMEKKAELLSVQTYYDDYYSNSLNGKNNILPYALICTPHHKSSDLDQNHKNRN